jgi:hypothetical protein
MGVNGCGIRLAGLPATRKAVRHGGGKNKKNDGDHRNYSK